MNCELFIDWNPDLIALHLGPLAIRWYALCWLIGFCAVYIIAQRIYKGQKMSDEQFEPLFLYCFVGVIAGARLGHCIFYQPDYFLASTKGVFEMFIPVKLFGDGVISSLTSGQWKFIGYEGLASHGGTLGLMLALVAYSRRIKVPLLFTIDTVALATPVMACLIRLGNLMNSEIIGTPTDLPWAFIFHRVDEVPRHPGQLYEAIAYAILALIMYILYRRHNRQAVTTNKAGVRTDFSARTPKAAAATDKKTPAGYPDTHIGTGFYFGLCLTYIFLFRIFIELTKENQEAFEDGMALNMGQLLSVPFVILGLYFMFRSRKKTA